MKPIKKSKLIIYNTDDVVKDKKWKKNHYLGEITKERNSSKTYLHQ
jgi:hypothetical protein